MGHLLWHLYKSLSYYRPVWPLRWIGSIEWCFTGWCWCPLCETAASAEWSSPSTAVQTQHCPYYSTIWIHMYRRMAYRSGAACGAVRFSGSAQRAAHPTTFYCVISQGFDDHSTAVMKEKAIVKHIWMIHSDLRSPHSGKLEWNSWFIRENLISDYFGSMVAGYGITSTEAHCCMCTGDSDCSPHSHRWLA